MSAHMKTHHTEQFEVIVKVSGKRKIHTSLPQSAFSKLEAFLSDYSESKNDSVDWKIVAKDSLKKHKQAGMVLRGARFRESMSQKELARRSGVSQENISRIENGKRQIGEKVAKKLAKPLKIDYLLLLEDYTDPVG
jgi:ribosome-binding protein aMBF1 (putative translation factor)